MSDARDVLREADSLRSIATRARALSASMAVERNGSIEINRTTLYQHAGYPSDLVLINAMREALDRVAVDYAAEADRLEARVVVAR